MSEERVPPMKAEYLAVMMHAGLITPGSWGDYWKAEPVKSDQEFYASFKVTGKNNEEFVVAVLDTMPPKEED